MMMGIGTPRSQSNMAGIFELLMFLVRIENSWMMSFLSRNRNCHGTLVMVWLWCGTEAAFLERDRFTTSHALSEKEGYYL